MKKKLFKGNMREMSMLIALIVIIIFFTMLTNGTLLRPMNIANLINQNAYVVILACGMLLCILTGGNIDLSVGSTVALVGACAGTFIITWKWDPYLSILLCLLIGIGLGAWQGFWIAYVGIPPFICTLSGMLVFRGITLLILNGLTLAPFPAAYTSLSTGFIPDIVSGGIQLFGSKLNLLCILTGAVIAVIYIVLQFRNNATRKKKGYETEPLPSMLIKMVIISAAIIAVFWKLAQHKGIPTVLIILGLLLLVYNFITQKTVMGRHLYAIGGNRKAAELSGVKTKRMMFLAYTNMSFIAAIAGLVFSARLNSSSPVAGQSFEMDAIASCFIGGASAYGGTGTIGGALIGALIMGTLNNGMSIMGISSNTQQVVKGLVLLIAVAIDVLGKKNYNLKGMIDSVKGLFKKSKHA
ncbi:MAG: sugar ABC transporter permease [Clostridia bacterium]|nr:sugar ABC transporter permease [Clostridia bacterium]